MNEAEARLRMLAAIPTHTTEYDDEDGFNFPLLRADLAWLLNERARTAEQMQWHLLPERRALVLAGVKAGIEAAVNEIHDAGVIDPRGLVLKLDDDAIAEQVVKVILGRRCG